MRESHSWIQRELKVNDDSILQFDNLQFELPHRRRETLGALFFAQPTLALFAVFFFHVRYFVADGRFKSRSNFTSVSCIVPSAWITLEMDKKNNSKFWQPRQWSRNEPAKWILYFNLCRENDFWSFKKLSVEQSIKILMFGACAITL